MPSSRTSGIHVSNLRLSCAKHGPEFGDGVRCICQVAEWLPRIVSGWEPLPSDQVEMLAVFFLRLQNLLHFILLGHGRRQTVGLILWAKDRGCACWTRRCDGMRNLGRRAMRLRGRHCLDPVRRRRDRDSRILLCIIWRFREDGRASFLTWRTLHQMGRAARSLAC